MYKLHIFITFHAHAITVYTFVTLYEFAYTCAVYSTFLNASSDTVFNAVRDHNFLREEKKAKPGLENFVNNRYNFNFITYTIADILNLQNIRIFLEF